VRRQQSFKQYAGSVPLPFAEQCHRLGSPVNQLRIIAGCEHLDRHTLSFDNHLINRTKRNAWPKGAAFCVGYDTSAQDMVNNGNIRAVAANPGACTTASCVLGGSGSVAWSVLPGWNLLGNTVNRSVMVATQFGDASKVNSVWKWDSPAARWQFYTPNLGAAVLQSYAANLGYDVLSEIQPGDGFWLQAKVQADLGTLSGGAINLRQGSLASGWNLVATASTITAKDFNLSLSTVPPAGQLPIN